MPSRRNRFYPLAGLAPALWAILAGCQPTGLSPTEPASEPPIRIAAKPVPSTVRLGMTVSDAGYQIQSDGLGEYLDGVDGMTVTIDGYGNLQIGPGNINGTTPPVRRLDVHYPVGQVYTFPNQWTFKIKSNKTNNGNPSIQDMVVGTALCYNVTIFHATQAISYEDAFNTAVNPGAGYVLITRTGAGSWTMASSGVATTGLDCGADDIAWVKGTDLTVRRGGGFTVGLVNQSFAIALRALP
jgi:hypothetical protein